MTHKQHPLGTPFTPASTADDVLAGIDLTGSERDRHRRSCRHRAGGHPRARQGWRVRHGRGSRPEPRRRRAGQGSKRVEVGQLDLIDPRSIDAFAARWLESGRPLHILVNGAGASGGPERDARGYETQFATNHLGHFQLTLALLPALRAAHGARVVNVSSGAQRFGRIRWDDPNFTEGYDSRAAYAQSKTANVLFAVELDRRWAANGIRGYAVHPGVVVGTKLNSSAGDEALKRMGLIDDAGQPIIDPAVGKKTPSQGASTIVFAATSPLLADIGGVYLKDNDISALDDGPRQLTAESIPAEVASHSIEPASAERLWELSERLLDSAHD